MTDIVWGAGIVVNGVRPDWLEDDEYITIKQYGGDWIDYGPKQTAQDWYWPPIKFIKLPADHPYYTAQKSLEKELDGVVNRISLEADRASDFSNLHYVKLRLILNEAYEQAATGKGAERHANGKSWDEQPIAEIGRMVGIGFNTGQAIKKLQESSRMEPDAAVRELLGAIVYAASAIMLIREKGEA